MDNASLQQRAEQIAQQYFSQLPADYHGRYSAIADQDTLTTLFKAVSAGLSIKDSCAAAGINETTYHRWMRTAEADPESAYALLASDLKAAKANGKLWHLENIKKHSQKEWTASAWTLERTDPEQFALRKDDNQTPKVIVQIGVRDGDVAVSVSPSPQGQLGEGVQNL